MMILSAIIITFIVILDQLSKYLVVENMALYQSIPLIKDVFHLTYVQNTGASFGIFSGARYFFIAITIILIAAVIAYVIKTKISNKLFLIAASFVVGGGIGNLIDRILLGYVVDFFDFTLINFAIFNVADCFVVIGVILMFIYVILNMNGQENGKN